MGKTTDGKPTNEYYTEWAQIYNKFFSAYHRHTPPIPHALKELYDEVTTPEQDLSDPLRKLEKYYDVIERFLEDAKSAGNSSWRQESLTEAMDWLCDRQTLDAYVNEVNWVLRKLASIADKIGIYISYAKSSSKQPDAKEIGILNELLATVKSISVNVSGDYIAERQQQGWGAYKTTRREALQAKCRV